MIFLFASEVKKIKKVLPVLFFPLAHEKVIGGLFCSYPCLGEREEADWDLGLWQWKKSYCHMRVYSFSHSDPFPRHACAPLNVVWIAKFNICFFSHGRCHGLHMSLSKPMLKVDCQCGGAGKWGHRRWLGHGSTALMDGLMSSSRDWVSFLKVNWFLWQRVVSELTWHLAHTAMMWFSMRSSLHAEQMLEPFSWDFPAYSTVS